jgi:cysteine-rich repeat protein
VIAGAADGDRDDLADPFDNCPEVSNVDQADLDGDGAGDACDRMTCGNGVRELAEQCDDGNLVEGDGCSARCFTPIGELLAFFDASVRSGRLVGSGPGRSGAGRLEALRNQLEALGRNYDRRATQGTCGKLGSVLERADGSPRPLDFVAGDDRPELADRIGELQSALGCDG